MKLCRILYASVLFIGVTLLFLSGCTWNKSSDNNIDTESIVMEKDQEDLDNEKEQIVMENEAKNACVKHLLDDFSYLFTDIQNDVKAVKKQSFNAVVTILISEYDNDMRCFWLYDAKRKMIYQDINPYTAYMLCDYKNAYNLSDTDKNDLTILLEKSNVHEWDERYLGSDIGTGAYSWSIVIEYNTGVLEKHSGRGQNSNKPLAFQDIIDYFSSFKYVDNPLYEE